MHSLWSIDYYNRSSLTRAAAFAAVSGNAIVGTSVTPLFARSPLALAAAAADVQAIAGGRFVLGVGSSTRRMNQDWYGTPLQHPAPQVRERIELIRRLIAHRSGPFSYEGRFDRVSMAHYDRTALPDSLTILAAGVGEHMVGVAGECADGFVGHTIASAGYLRDIAVPLLARGAARANRDAAELRMTTQIVAAAAADPRAARRDAAARSASTPPRRATTCSSRTASSPPSGPPPATALARGDVPGVIAAGEAMVDERAVFGTPGRRGRPVAPLRRRRRLGAPVPAALRRRRRAHSRQRAEPDRGRRRLGILTRSPGTGDARTLGGRTGTGLKRHENGTGPALPVPGASGCPVLIAPAGEGWAGSASRFSVGVSDCLG